MDLNKHLQIAARQGSASLGITKNKGKPLNISYIFQICETEALGPCVTGASLVNKFRCPGLSTFVTLKDPG